MLTYAGVQLRQMVSELRARLERETATAAADREKISRERERISQPARELAPHQAAAERTGPTATHK